MRYIYINIGHCKNPSAPDQPTAAITELYYIINVYALKNEELYRHILKKYVKRLLVTVLVA